MEDFVIDTRTDGSLGRRAFYLEDGMYDWVLVRDEDDALCLVPLKKQ